MSWYLRCPLSYRDIEELLLERGLEVEHSTVNRRVLASERLDVVPAQFRVLLVRRPKYACRVTDGVAQALAPARLIESGLPADATVAQVLVPKYADHLPLYRQAQIFVRQGVILDRSALADLVGRTAALLEPVHGLIIDQR